MPTMAHHVISYFFKINITAHCKLANHLWLVLANQFWIVFTSVFTKVVMIRQCVCSPWISFEPWDDSDVEGLNCSHPRNLSLFDLHGCFKPHGMSMHVFLLWHVAWKWKTMAPHFFCIICFSKYKNWNCTIIQAVVTSSSRSMAFWILPPVNHVFS